MVAHLRGGLPLLCRQIWHRLNCDNRRWLRNQRVYHADFVIRRFVVGMKRRRDVLLKIRVCFRFIFLERSLSWAFVSDQKYVRSFVVVDAGWTVLLTHKGSRHLYFFKTEYITFLKIFYLIFVYIFIATFSPPQSQLSVRISFNFKKI